MPIYATWTGDAHHTYATVMKGNAATGPRFSLEEVGPDGRATWSTDIGRAGSAAPVYAYGSLFSGSYRFHPGVVAVNAATGAVRWAANLGRNLHLAAANHLLVVANDQTGQISVLSAGSGKVLRQLTLPTKPYSVSGLAIAGGTIYVTDASGLTAIRP
jgi:outer membrane protein assembly factor BamB